MKLLLSVIFLFISGLSFGQSSPTTISGNIDSLLCPKGYAAIGQPYLSFTLTSGKKVVDNQSLHGKVVFINFWFEGCHPCMAEMDALNELNDSLKANKDFLMISFTWDNPETVERVKKRFGLNFMVLATQQCSKMNFGLGYPTTMILDRVGVIRYIKNGGFLEPEKARKTIFQDIMPEVKRQL